MHSSENLKQNSDSMLINITFPNNTVKQFPKNTTGADIATSISISLAKKAVAAKINGVLKDLSHAIQEDAKIEIIVAESPEGLDIIRHDAAHILAQAVKKLYPEVQVTIGPTIENGFFYDFATKNPFNEEDLAKIEKEMQAIVAANLPITRSVMSRDEAIKYFTNLGEEYKVEIIKDLPSSEEISVYFQGDFADLCRGPHAPSTSHVKALKLMKVAGAYWRGDSKNEMLQRIYGTAWASKEGLDGYLHMIEEAEKRDHRKIGKEMDLFHFQDSAPGAVFWHHNGWIMFQELIGYMRRKQRASGYQEINTPEVLDKCLWEQSGHWEKYGANMFVATAGDEDREYAIKPMNCPGGVQVFKHSLRSYRELPLRMAEFGKVHRFEASGALHGLMRVRAFTQDDAHIFCTPDQLISECKRICDMILSIYKDFGFEDVRIKFSDRPEMRIGSDEVWDKSEEALQNAVNLAGLEWTLNPGEGAFYGPKLEFVLRDAIGRDWQVGTLQVDLNLPLRLGANYIGEDGGKHQAVMLHQATFGSLERFVGIALEHYAGHLPLWLAPVQVVVTNITNDVDDYAKEIHELLLSKGVRSVLDLESEKINNKIRKHSLSKVPLIAVIGKNEVATRSLSVRKLGSMDQETIAVSDFVDRLLADIKAPF